MVKAGKGSGATGGEVSATKPLSDEEKSWIERADVQPALNVIRDYATTNPENIRPGDNLELDLGLDSMRRVELLVAIEQALGGDVDESQLSNIYTVRELVDAVLESASSGTTSAKPQFAGWSAVLREDPTDPEALRITKPQPVTDRLIFVLTRIVKLIWHLRSRIQIEGMENVPRSGCLSPIRRQLRNIRRRTDASRRAASAGGRS